MLYYLNNYIGCLSYWNSRTVCSISIMLKYYVLNYFNGKNGFAEISQNLTKYRSENNLVEPLK